VISLLDYGIGNLRSLQKAFEHVGGEVRVVTTPEEVAAADKLVVPGVGAFGQAVGRLNERGLDRAIHAAVGRGALFLGVCVGMQLLFETSCEHGVHRGLGLLKGHVRRLPDTVKLPQVGWNRAEPTRPDPLLEGLEKGEYVYFDHSYYCEPEDSSDALTLTEHGLRYASAVRRGRICAVQFHPEKSQKAGLKLLENFVGLS